MHQSGNQLTTFVYIYQAKIPAIIWFQLLKYEDIIFIIYIYIHIYIL